MKIQFRKFVEGTELGKKNWLIQPDPYCSESGAGLS